MKAKRLLQLYADGRIDFRGENLRGQSFKGKKLSGADFSGADIRGANFTNATLQGAKFIGAKAGLQRRWASILVLIMWLLSGFSWFSSFLTAVLMAFIFNAETQAVIGWVSLAFLVIFWIIAFRKGVLTAFGFNIFAEAGAFTFAGAVAFAFAGAGAFAFVLAFAFAGAFAGAFAFAFAVAVVVAGAFAFALAGAFAFAFALAFVFAVAGAGAEALVVAGAFAFALLSSYIGWRAIEGDPRDARIRTAAIAFAATGGTSFRGANLTDADFTDATLKSTDLRGAILTRTRWKNTIKLDRLRPGTSYLHDPKIRELVRTEEGQQLNCDGLNLQGVNLQEAKLQDASFVDANLNEANLRDADLSRAKCDEANLQGVNLQGANLQDASFTGANLQGVNLQNANLQDASFIGANLNDANLQGADLSRAKLVQTQLDKTHLADATLTGAYIEDWGITTHTKLDGVKCAYVYMRLPTKENPEPWRKPDNNQEEFGDGDFIDFIKPLQDTLDLYHNQQVDPRAVTIAFNQLAENHPEAGLSIAAMEVRGENNDKFLVRAKTASGANHSELSAEYFDNYNKFKSLPSDALIVLLAEKDNQIKLLAEKVDKAIITPKISAEYYHNEGDTMTENKSSGPDLRGAKIEGTYVGRDQNVKGVNAGRDHTGGIFNDYSTVSESKQTLAEAAHEIQQLLTQLEQSNPSPTEIEQIAYLTDETTPSFKRRTVNALKSAGQAAIEEFLDNPYVNVAIATIEGWQEKD